MPHSANEFCDDQIETGNWEQETGTEDHETRNQKPVASSQFSVLSCIRGFFHDSACNCNYECIYLPERYAGGGCDSSVATSGHCGFQSVLGSGLPVEFLPRGELLTEGWWQISVTDNPDQAGALGYHELTSRGTPLGKVFAGLDLQSGGSWTVTLSHELLEMLADPWINWCAQGSDGKNLCPGSM